MPANQSRKGHIAFLLQSLIEMQRANVLCLRRARCVNEFTALVPIIDVFYSFHIFYTAAHL